MDEATSGPPGERERPSTNRTGRREPRPLGVYVHFPWCIAKCPYCDFLSLASPREAIPHADYADAVLAELGRRAPDLMERPVTSIFFGGGTPSLWAPSQLARVLEGIRSAFSASRATLEISVECNPSSFDGELARALVDAGVNRVSLGVQSLDDTRLRFLGRLHDARGGRRAIETALAASVPRVSADLIFGVAGQAPENASREAAEIADTGITHLSAYALTIEPGTQFGALAKKGRLPLLDESRVAESFIAVRESLSLRDFEHYEVSNYARAGHRAEHNLGYWRGDDYLGLGTGAWGTLTAGGERVRYRNTPSVERYLEATRDDPPPDDVDELAVHTESLTAETALSERIMLGLRLADGVDLDAAGTELGVDPWPAARRRAVERLTERGALEREAGRLWIPPSRWLLADGVIAEVM